jgi:hypothetical protein
MGTHRMTWMLPAGVATDALAVVAFVQQGADQEVLQAVRWTARDCRG